MDLDPRVLLNVQLTPAVTVISRSPLPRTAAGHRSVRLGDRVMLIVGGQVATTVSRSATTRVSAAYYRISASSRRRHHLGHADVRTAAPSRRRADQPGARRYPVRLVQLSQAIGTNRAYGLELIARRNIGR
jgi:hypothetical protein